ncbi:HEPN domain-containing protein [Azospirillum largimobile]
MRPESQFRREPVYHASAAYFRLDATGEYARHSDVHDLLKGMKLDSNPPRYIVAAKRVHGELKRLRVRADYYVKEHFSADDADRALQLAQMVIVPSGR